MFNPFLIEVPHNYSVKREGLSISFRNKNYSIIDSKTKELKNILTEIRASYHMSQYHSIEQTIVNEINYRYKTNRL